MNVLESLKINEAMILSLKDNDILFIKVKEGTNNQELNDISKAFREVLDKKGHKSVAVAVSSSIENIKIIRR